MEDARKMRKRNEMKKREEKIQQACEDGGSDTEDSSVPSVASKGSNRVYRLVERDRS